jgi:hypothetical protein
MRYLSVLLVWISVVGWTTTVMAQECSTQPQPAGGARERAAGASAKCRLFFLSALACSQLTRQITAV